jgi:hypothetical protein
VYLPECEEKNHHENHETTLFKQKRKTVLTPLNENIKISFYNVEPHA